MVPGCSGASKKRWEGVEGPAELACDGGRGTRSGESALLVGLEACSRLLLRLMLAEPVRLMLGAPLIGPDAGNEDRPAAPGGMYGRP